MNCQTHEFDVCVVGGGMAGLCAAVAAARPGAHTALVQDRPVLGGNASSEVRMWICGAHGPHNKETGLLEELQLENLHRNPTGNYSIWDSVLYGKAAFQEGLRLFLNCSCTDAERDGSRLVAIRAWQLTTQTWHKLHARYFLDCSGDSILAPASGAEFRVGREARHEFDEDIQPPEADRKTMGNSILIQIRRTDQPQPFVPPRWAYRFDSPDDLPYRIQGVRAQNFWWIELGGLQDTIRDAETIRDELLKVAYGVWDYIKNRAPARAEAEKWAVEWIGSLPGKRENRRYVGDYILTQNDLRAGGAFPDIIAYGGWSMDDHHPAGLLYPGRPTIFHPAPSPYGIPYRCLFSRNIANLFFAGRNISVTHAALSSTRVMGTCALLGQAAGTAAALCVRHRCDPRGLLSGDRLTELQQTLLDDDCWLPGLSRSSGELARQARLEATGAHAPLLRDGIERDRPDQPHAWEAVPGDFVEYRWDGVRRLAGARLVFDSDLSQPKRMPCSYPHLAKMPGALVRGYRLETQTAGGHWDIVFRESDNHQRLVRVPLSCAGTALRLVIESTWGAPRARVFAFEPLSDWTVRVAPPPLGPRFCEVRARVPAADLAPPASAPVASPHRVGA